MSPEPVDLSPLFLHFLVEGNALLLEVSLDIPDLSLVVMGSLVELVDLRVTLNHISLEGKETVLIGLADFS